MTVGVLFVSTGGICRSPTAAGIFSALAERAGLGQVFEVDSASVYDGHAGNPPALPAIEAASRRGYDIAGRRARPLIAEDIARFDHVLAMDRTNLAAVRWLAPPRLAERPQLFLKFAVLGGAGDVADPYGGTPTDYVYALNLIEAGCTGLLEALRAPREVVGFGVRQRAAT